jgi:hypothetical protein
MKNMSCEKKTALAVRTDLKAGGWWVSMKEKAENALDTVKNETAGAWAGAKGWVQDNMKPLV